jgi:hypothetical protein
LCRDFFCADNFRSLWRAEFESRITTLESEAEKKQVQQKTKATTELQEWQTQYDSQKRDRSSANKCASCAPSVVPLGVVCCRWRTSW